MVGLTVSTIRLPESAMDRPRKLELVWREKGDLPHQSSTGTWQTVPEALDAEIYPLFEEFRTGESSPSLVVSGDRLSALSTLRKVIGPTARLIFADVPRIEGFDETRSFTAESGRTWGTWLSMVREHV